MKALLFHPLTFSVDYEVYVLHEHSCWEMNFIIKGETDNIIDGKVYKMKCGDCIILSPNNQHYFKINKSKPYCHRDLYIQDGDMKIICDSLGDNFYEELLKNNLKIINIDIPLLEALESKMLFLERESINNISKIIPTHRAVVSFILGLYNENQFNNNQRYPIWLKNFIENMHKTENICGDFDNLVKISQYSKEHLSRVFKKYTSETLISFFTKLKLNYSMMLLINTDLSVLEICMNIGYDSISHYIHLFKYHYGLTPGQFRLKNKK